ncbi:hypothetical protein PHJA_001020100 [Phtheirospermum japonicum]|uniref:DUF7725 domain-containing protein n=1 Tax=Phtheirospermum japonicum TaxID=374723 RepID=A0A830BWS7_9LAMI|nr:hypothetical protein PHJA_001020100 [Phtheirospermum japonicum]
MEAAPGALAAERNGVVSLPPQMSSSSSRKEWRIVSEQSVRNSGNEELERTKLGQSDERLIYENGREPLDVDFCSITIDGGLDNDILQQQIHNVSKQREEYQNMEIEFRAQAIARSEIVGLQNRFDAQLKEHSNATLKLQEQLHEKEHKIHELERRMDEKERELHAIRLDNEAAWAKEDLFREQSQELQSYRMEIDNSEAERAQHIKQIHDLQEHMQEKERQFIELQEQHRVAQETINFKDEQIREAQAWITRAQEVDVLQLNTNQALQAELRDRTEQYNQLWLLCQRQFGEMERLHLHIQQLQLEMTDAREKSGTHSDGLRVTHTNTNDASGVADVNHSQLEGNDNNSASANIGSIQNDNTETSGGNTLTQTDQVQSVAFAPSSLFGMQTYLPAGLHPFLMHQQGVPHPSHIGQPHFHSLNGMSPIQNWQGQQALPEGEHVSTHDQYTEQTEGNLLRNDSHYNNYKSSVNGQVLHANYLDSEARPGLDADSVLPSPNEEGQQVHDPIEKSHDNAEPQNLQQISSQFDDALRLGSLEHGSDTKEKKGNPVIDHGLDNKSTIMEHSKFAMSASSSEASIHALSNRLGRMIAPLHWHDYKKKYGKLDDFLASHPDLFLIEGDYIQLREGAQEIIAAAAAVAKVAAIGPSSYSPLMPPVALTPMSQSHRSKTVSSLESSLAVQNKNLNGGSFPVSGGVSNVQNLSKSKEKVESNDLEMRSGRAPLPIAGNGTNSDRNDYSHRMGASHGRHIIEILIFTSMSESLKQNSWSLRPLLCSANTRCF